MSSLDILLYFHNNDSWSLPESFGQISGCNVRFLCWHSDGEDDRYSEHPNVRFISGSPSDGIVKAMNRLLAESESEYVMFCDRNTLIIPSGLKELISTLDHLPECAGVYGLNYGYREDSGDICFARGGKLGLFSLFESCPIGPGSVILRRNAINGAGGILQLETYGDFGWDTFLYTRLALKSPLLFIPQPVSASICHQQITDFYDFNSKISINALLACGEKLVTKRLRDWFMKEYKTVLDGIQAGKLSTDNPVLAVVSLGFLAHMPEVSSRNLDVILKTALRLAVNDFSLFEFVVQKMVERKRYVDARNELDAAYKHFSNDHNCHMRILALKKLILAATVQVSTDTDEHFSEVYELLDKEPAYYVSNEEKQRVEEWIKNNRLSRGR